MIVVQAFSLLFGCRLKACTTMGGSDKIRNSGNFFVDFPRQDG
jgi:hypothetical protein